MSTPEEFFQTEDPEDVNIRPRKSRVFEGTAIIPGVRYETLPEVHKVREHEAYQWSRETFLDFVDRVRTADLDSPMLVEELRSYLMKQLVAHSGNPDAKHALRAVELLGKVKNIDLFETARMRPMDGMSADDLMAEVTKVMRR